MTQTHKQKTFTACLLVFALSALLLSGCGRKDLSKTGFYFNTVITVTLYHSNAQDALDHCFEMAADYEKLFSAAVPGSDIDRINSANGEAVTVDDETIALLQKGLEYCELSEGRFDITIGNLSSLWDFSNNDGTVPDDAFIQDAVSTVDYHAVQLDGNSVTVTNPAAHIDLGGIAKGYIADRMKAYLNEQGITSGIINLGGNVLVLGQKEDGTDYRIGIQKPFSEDGTALASVGVRDETVVSSGVYERYFYKQDTLYHHILNPATGYPYDNGLLGVSIICRNSVDGDGLSTTCFALGPDAGMQLIESLPDTEAIFITNDNELHCSSGIGSSIPFEPLNN